LRRLGDPGQRVLDHGPAHHLSHADCRFAADCEVILRGSEWPASSAFWQDQHMVWPARFSSGDFDITNQLVFWCTRANIHRFKQQVTARRTRANASPPGGVDKDFVPDRWPIRLS
jgi:hypothetical protein